MPLISPRSFIVACYPIIGDDEVTFMVSTQGNEELLKKHAEKIGKDVIGDIFINYIHFKSDGNGGCKGTHVA